MLNSEAPVRIPTTFAPVIVRLLKIENGISGEAERSSIATKAASSATAPASRPIVWPEPQPASGASISAYTSSDRPAVTLTAPAKSKFRVSDSERLSPISDGASGGGDDPDRHVHPQHPLPAGVLGEHAAEQDARRAAGAGDRAPDAQRLIALGAVAEGRGDDRERGGGEERGAEALHGAGGDQHPLGLVRSHRPARRSRR